MSRTEATFLAAEYAALSARWDVLYGRLRAEGDTVHIRQHLQRVEALTGALIGA
ncbi:hypothetical protein [Streptomyces sp. NPDC055681]